MRNKFLAFILAVSCVIAAYCSIGGGFATLSDVQVLPFTVRNAGIAIEEDIDGAKKNSVSIKNNSVINDVDVQVVVTYNWVDSNGNIVDADSLPSAYQLNVQKNQDISAGIGNASSGDIYQYGINFTNSEDWTCVASEENMSVWTTHVSKDSSSASLLASGWTVRSTGTPAYSIYIDIVAEVMESAASSN